jgi:hypothetical protein
MMEVAGFEEVGPDKNTSSSFIAGAPFYGLEWPPKFCQNYFNRNTGKNINHPRHTKKDTGTLAKVTISQPV